MDTPPDLAPGLTRQDSIVILGAGRLGVHLAFHLRVAGAEQVTLWNRTPLPPARLQLLSSSLTPPQFPALLSGRLPLEALGKARLVLMTVADDALAPLAARLAREATPAPACAFLHCSGALTSAELEPLAARGLATGSMHPLQSFSGIPVAYGLRETFFALEGASVAVEAAVRVVEWLEGRIVRLRPQGKVHYHTAAVMASNLTVALVAMAVDLMGEATGPEVSARERLELLMPLIEGTVANLRRTGLPGALTGPVSRGDAGVVARQLAALKGGPEDATLVYRSLSRRALELARAQGLPPEACEVLDRLIRSRG